METILRIQDDVACPPPFLIFKMGEVPKAEGVRMLSLHKSLSAARNPSEQDRLAREVASTDGEIDSLVYELYGLSEDEIRIVEAE